MDEKKDKLLQIRISDDYNEKLKKLAIERGISVSLLVRNAIEYIPGTETEEEIKKGLDYAKTCNSSSLVFGLKDIIDMIKQEYNYEFNYVPPANEILIDMYDKEIFKNLNNIAMKSITDRLVLDPNYRLDKNTEKILKDLISAYMKK